MANTYSQIYIHIVFTVQGRQNLIIERNRVEIQKFISGIISARKQKLIAIYVMPDHVHLLVSINPSISVSDLVRDIKAGSSKFINENKWVRGKFNWQHGFGAFSYAKSQIDIVVKYILNQPNHHKKRTFKDEYIELLKKFEVNYKNDYLFDWIKK